MIRYLLSFWISVCLLTLPGTAMTADEPGSDAPAIDLKDPALRDFGVKKVNRMLGKKFPFLELSYSDVDDDNDESGFILGYDWNKDWNKYEYVQGSIDKDYGATIYQASLFAKGSHGIGDVTNPNNKSEVGFSIDLSRAGFGKLKKQLIRDESDKLRECLDNIPFDDPDIDVKSVACAQKYRAIEVFEANHAREYQWIYGIDAHAKMEGDEDFAQKHFVFGLELIGTFNPPAKSLLSWLNILDWPFFITRKAVDGDKKFHPDWPVFRTGIQSVEVEDNDPRETFAPNDDSFIRYYGEVAFTTNVCTIDGKTIKFNTAYEYYKEIDADSRIKSAGLDDFGFFSVSFQVPVALLTEKVSDRNMFFVRYVNGELPFDRKSTKAFEIGWQTSFDPMGLISDPK